MNNNSNVMTINLNSVIKNYYKILEEFNPYKLEKKIVCVLKSNCYGFGVNQIAKILIEKTDCRIFAVSNLYEALNLRNIDNNIKIITLNGFDYSNTNLYKEFNITPIISSMDQLNNISDDQYCWIHFDTGINRTGIPIYEWDNAEQIIKNKNTDTIMTHLSCTKNVKLINEKKKQILNKQLNLINDLVKKYSKFDTSIFKTSALSLGLDNYYNNIRVGHGLYFEYSYINTMDIANWQSTIMEIKTVKPGEYIGYDSKFQAKELTKIAVVNTGYSHGLKLNHPYVIINNKKCPIVGVVSMEIITVDISSINDCNLSTPVYIFYNNWKEISEILNVSCGFLSCNTNIDKKYVI